MDPGSVQAVFPQVRGQFGRSRCPGQTTVDQVVSTRGPEAWSRRRQAWSWSWTGIGGPVVMHHGPVTLGAAWCLVLGAPGGGAGQAWLGVGCRLALVVGSSSASFRGCDLHVCNLTDILGVNRGCCGDFFLVVFGLVGGCFGGVQALEWL